MSQDPQRLLSATGDADELERELLASVRQVDPPRGAHTEVWGGIAAQIAAVTLVTAAGASAVESATTAGAGTTLATQAGKAGAFTLSKAFATKVVLGLALGGAAAGAGSAWIQSRKEPARLMEDGARSASIVARSSASVLHLRAALSATAPDSAAGERTPPTAALPTEPNGAIRRPLEPSDRLGAESQLLAKARAELRSGDPAAAQATLRRLQSRFPNGGLRQEREVLAIEILSARGNTAASEQRAKDFIKAHPESPHSTNLRRLLEHP